MAQISRKQLKSDEFVSGMDAAYEFFLQHRNRIILIAVVVLVVAGGGYGFYAWRNARNQKAALQLSQAVATLHVPLATDSGVAAGTATYPDAAHRAQAAEPQLQAVINAYGGTPAGQLARYYLGLAQLDANDAAAAENTLNTAAASSDPVASTAAKHALANLAIAQGQPAQAHALLLQLVQQDSATLPRAVALMELADLDRTYNPKEAAQYYKQLQSDYPGTATAQQAQQDLANLGQ